MNTHRTLGLLAAILVTAGQAALLAVDTAAGAQNSRDRAPYESILGTQSSADAQRAYGESRGLVGG